MDLIFDFETSVLEPKGYLGERGVVNYVNHPTACVISFAYWYTGMDTPKVWLQGEPLPELPKRVTNLIAHNMSFDFRVWEALFDAPMPKYKQLRDTMIYARFMALPASLANLSVLLSTIKSVETKNQEAGKILAKVSWLSGIRKSNSSLLSEEVRVNVLSDDDKDTLRLYNISDVASTRDAYLFFLSKLSPTQLDFVDKAFNLDWSINKTGFEVDTRLCREVQSYIEKKKERITKIYELLGVNLASQKQFIDYVGDKLNFPLKDCRRQETLEPALVSPSTPDKVKEIIRDRLDIVEKSGNKFTKALDLEKDGVVYDSLALFKVHTGRFAGQGLQPQNLPKASVPNNTSFNDLRRVVKGNLKSDLNWRDLSSALVPTIIKARKGTALACIDFTAIELRLCLLAVNSYKSIQSINAGKDLYKELASFMYSKKEKLVTKEERTVAKITMLSCQYGTGAAKLHATISTYKPDFTEEEAQKSVNSFRGRYSEIVHFWKELEHKFYCAVQKPGTYTVESGVGLLKFVRPKGKNSVCIELPTGQTLWFYAIKVEDGQTLFKRGDQLVKAKAFSSIYGAKILENIIQSLSASITLNALFKINKLEGVQVLFNVHDEIVSEVPEDTGGKMYDKIAKIMTTVPKWAKGLKLDVEGVLVPRYVKSNLRFEEENENKKIQLFDYQREGVEKFFKSIERQEKVLEKKNKLRQFPKVPAFFLGDEMGLGKTIQALEIIKQRMAVCPSTTSFIDSNGKKVEVTKKWLIVVPPVLFFKWVYEIKRYFPNVPCNFYQKPKQAVREEAKIVLSTYTTLQKSELIFKYSDYVKEYDLVVFDEGHYLKNAGSKRSIHFSGIKLAKATDAILLLSGTFLSNNIRDLHSLMNNFCDSMIGTYNNLFNFLMKFSAYYSRRGNILIVKGVKNEEELKRLIEPFFVRRIKKGILKEFPPLMRTIIHTEVSEKGDIQKAIEGEQRVMQELRGHHKDAEVNEDLLLSVGYNSVEFRNVMAFRRTIGLAKIPNAIEFIKGVLEEKEKLLVFCVFKKVARQLRDDLEGIYKKGVCFCSGSMSTKARYEQIDKFSNDPSKRLLVATVRSIKEGVDIVCTDTILYVELDYSLEVMLQSEARVHRLGQKSSSVQVYYSSIGTGFDKHVSKALSDKVEVYEKVMGSSAG